MPFIMLSVVKRAPTAAALAASLALAVGCGEAGGRDSAAVENVAETVEEFEAALGDRDLARVCDQLFSPEARRRAGGEECPRRLARTTASVERPKLELLSVALDRVRATARVRAWAGEERPAIDSMRLVPGEGGYRIDSLSGG